MRHLTSQARRSAVAVTVLALLMSLGAALSPATALVPQPPAGLSLGSVPAGSQPLLQWNRVPGATAYDVEVSSSSTFGTTVWKTTTVNRRATPPVQVPSGAVWWRVRTVSASERGDWAVTSFTQAPLAGPELQAPGDGTQLEQPQDPALLAWTPIHGATGYSVEISSDPNFTDPLLTTAYSSQTPSFVVPNPQVATTYHWRVRATLAAGIVTEWSDAWTYGIKGLARPELVAPADGPFSNVEDVVLEWEPVAGAKTYDLQVSTDINFQTLVQQPVGITGTRFSPPTTVANDQYYWRVRPVDSLGNKLDWSEVTTWTFRRHWPDQPVLEHPADNAVVGDPFYYQWTAVDHASTYVLQLSSAPDFTPSSIADTCTTVHTTLVPRFAGDCWPGASGTYWWRVSAVDAPGSSVDGAAIVTDAISAQVGRFTYDPDRPALLSPTSGSTVDLPTLRWDAVAGAASYRVTLTATDGGSGGGTFTTSSTSYTPRSLLTPGKSYRWTVQTVNGSRLGSALTAGSQPTFTVAEQPAAVDAVPEPTGPANASSSYRFPTLRWTPVVSATRYRVLIRPVGGIGYSYLPDHFAYPAGEDAGTAWLTPGHYEWAVEAWNGNNLLATSATSRNFVIQSLDPVIGQRAALTGTSLGSGTTSCATALPERCQDLRQTPVLRWTRHPHAAGYRVFIARDKEMTNIVAGYPETTDTNMFTPTAALIDSQAGSAFYWHVQPCKSVQPLTGCSALQHASHAFNKLSNPVELVAPADGAVESDDVTFTWGDYLETNQDGSDPHATDDTGVHSRIEARQYRVQVATDPNFQTVLENVVVDQTTFTSYANTYPEGTLYWRVQAIDGTLNSLAWSPTRTFLKRSPEPVPVSPTDGATVPGWQAFRWQPLHFAGSYDIEVYKDADLTGSSSNRVLTGNSKQVAFSPSAPLPAASLPYTWRVRRVDAKGRPGAWSRLDLAASFTVRGDPPSPLSPTPGVFVPSTDGLFAWDAAPGATSYRFERRAVGSSSLAETVSTKSLVWAPTTALTDGSWQWRVVALDAAGKTTAGSAWQDFRVDGTRPAVLSRTPETAASRGADFRVTFTEPVTGVGSTTMKLIPSGSKGQLLATVSVSSDGRRATLDPRKNLVRGRRYRVVLSTTIADRAGNALVPVQWVVRAK